MTNFTIFDNIKSLNIPIILVINKIDQVSQTKTDTLISEWREHQEVAEIVAISALHCANTVFLLDRILSGLPEHPAYYPEDEMSDKNIRFFVSIFTWLTVSHS